MTGNISLRNYRVSGLCPSSGILNTRKHNVSETGPVSVLMRGEGDSLLGPSITGRTYTSSSESFRFYKISLVRYEILPFQMLFMQAPTYPGTALHRFYRKTHCTRGWSHGRCVMACFGHASVNRQWLDVLTRSAHHSQTTQTTPVCTSQLADCNLSLPLPCYEGMVCWRPGEQACVWALTCLKLVSTVIPPSYASRRFRWP
jgi:hypothetical protein